MKTIVIQFLRVRDVPFWVTRCLDSVSAWAALKGYDYSLSDALPGEHRAARSVNAIPNQSLLALADDAHRGGYDRVVWISPDVLVFNPELFTIDTVDRFAFTRLTTIDPKPDGGAASSYVSNCAFVCMRGEPTLNMSAAGASTLSWLRARLSRKMNQYLLTRLTSHFPVRYRITKVPRTGRYFLKRFHKSLAFETLDNIGLFNSHVVFELANGREDAIAAQVLKHETPIFATSLCGPEPHTGPVHDSLLAAAIDRLLESKGDTLNRALLQSPRTLLNQRANANLAQIGMARHVPRGTYEAAVRLRFKQEHGHEPNLSLPRTFNERIAARLLNLTDDAYAMTTDKYAVRKFVEERVGGDVLVPLLQVCERAEDLDVDSLLPAFLVKPTHGSGWRRIVRDKTTLDREALRSAMRKWLRWNYFVSSFEIHYRDIPPRIVAEPLLLTTDDNVPEDYRFHVFNGSVRMISVTQRDRANYVRSARFDPSWRRLIVGTGKNNPLGHVPPPTRLPRMIDVAEELARGFDFARVDLYCLKDRVFFGEITHNPKAGLGHFVPAEFDLVLGRIWETGGPIPEEYYATQEPSLPEAHAAPFDSRNLAGAA